MPNRAFLIAENEANVASEKQSNALLPTSSNDAKVLALLPCKIILPACRKMVKTMLGDEAEQKISKIPLSNNTIHRRIMDLSADIEENVQNKLQNSKLALQVDESTDIG